jgi:hypothetical protein
MDHKTTHGQSCTCHSCQPVVIVKVDPWAIVPGGLRSGS